MNSPAADLETAVPDLRDVAPDSLWLDGGVTSRRETALSDLLRELIAEAKRQGEESSVAAFASAL